MSFQDRGLIILYHLVFSLLLLLDRISMHTNSIFKESGLDLLLFFTLTPYVKSLERAKNRFQRDTFGWGIDLVDICCLLRLKSNIWGVSKPKLIILLTSVAQLRWFSGFIVAFIYFINRISRESHMSEALRWNLETVNLISEGSITLDRNSAWLEDETGSH